MKTILLLWLLVGAVGRAQSTLTLAPASGPSGGSAAMDFSLSSVAASAPAAIKWSFGYSTLSLPGFSIAPGPAAIAAGKTILCGTPGTPITAAVICVLYGLTTDVVQDGVIAKATFTIAPTATGTRSIEVSLYSAAALDSKNIVATGAGAILTITPGPPSKCDVDKDGVVGPADVQAAAMQVVGLASCTTADVDGVPGCEAHDLQRVARAVLTGQCP
jgi:hypothetical protein